MGKIAEMNHKVLVQLVTNYTRPHTGRDEDEGDLSTESARGEGDRRSEQGAYDDLKLVRV